MAEGGDEGRDVDPEPADGLSFDSGFSARKDKAVEQPDETGDDERHEWRRDEGVGDAAVMREADHRTTEAPEDVHVGSFGGQCGGERGVGSAAVEAGASDAGSSEEVGDRLHG